MPTISKITDIRVNEGFLIHALFYLNPVVSKLFCIVAFAYCIKGSVRCSEQVSNVSVKLENIVAQFKY